MDANHNGIRNAALLVASLDTAMADRLLQGLPDHQARQIREAAVMLDTIDDAEQQRLLDALRRGPAAARPKGAQPDDTPKPAKEEPSIVPTTEPAGIELDGRLAELCGGGDPAEQLRPWQPPRADQGPAGSADARHANSELPPLAFLHAAEGNSLAEALRDERPLTIAVVVAHLPPSRASELLARLEPPQRQQVVRRLAELEEADPEVLREIDTVLQSRLVMRMGGRCRHAVGTDAIEGILRECSPEMREQILGDLGKSEATAPGASGVSPVQAVAETEKRGASPAAKWSAGASGVSPVQAVAETEKRGASPAAKWSAGASGVSAVPGVVETEERGASPAAKWSSGEIDFEQLADLSDRDLARLATETHPQLLGLALLGASTTIVDRVRRLVSPAESQRLARRLHRPGPVRLSDIDKARIHITRLAARLDQQGAIDLSTTVNMLPNHA